MKVTIEFPDPHDGDVEKALVSEFTNLVSVCQSILNGYKAKGFAVPSISIRIPAKYRTTTSTQSAEKREFVQELLKFHMDRIPTANVPAQRTALNWFWESGYTDPTFLRNLYSESLKTWAATSWFTVRYKMSKQQKPEETSDSEFQRKELSPEDTESLKNRLTQSIKEFHENGG